GNTDNTLPSYQLAALLASGFQDGPGVWLDNKVSDVSYDGIFPTGTGGTAGNPANICSKNNGTIHFADMHFDQLVSPTTLLNATNVFDEAAFTSTCTATTVPPVTLTNI
ncbi:MAG: hypothetical protein ACXVXJ_10250, partial [Mycobacteriaceae bacterium]